jgi:hypothetical protein
MNGQPEPVALLLIAIAVGAFLTFVRTRDRPNRLWRRASAAVIVLMLVGLVGLTVAAQFSWSDTQQAGDQLAQGLRRDYPAQVMAVSFENSPPLDPPTLFIDLAPSMSPQQELRFLCDEIVPRIRATKASIAATVSYGWTDRDCQ